MNQRQQAIAYRLIGIFEDAHRDCEGDRLIEAEEADRLTPRKCDVCKLLEEFNAADNRMPCGCPGPDPTCHMTGCRMRTAGVES